MEISLPTISDSQADLIKNTLATGLSVCILVNAEVALVCMVVNVVFSLLAEDEDPISSWFKWDSKTVQDLKDYWEGSLPYIKFKIAAAIFFKFFGHVKSQGVTQRPIALLIQSLANPAYAIWIIFRACVIAPIIEEILFRGFIQEKLRNIQVLLFGEQAAASPVHKAVRIGIQALLFGALHFHPDQVGINGLVVVVTGLLGAYNGYLKEKTGTLWTPVAEHAHWNVSSTAAVLIHQI